MKTVTLIAFFISICTFSFAQSSNLFVSGPVSGNWSADTITVTGDIQVPGNESLIIDPGTLVLFTGHFKFDIKGFIRAEGTEEYPILFTISDTTGFHDTLSVSGGWHGFVFEHISGAADSSLFHYCVFEYGKAVSADTFGQYGGSFRIFDFGKIAIRHCTFRTNMAIRWGGAVYARNSDLHIENSSFIQNKCGLAVLPWGYGGGFCAVSSEPVVRYCYFEGNSATGFGGGAAFEYSDPVVCFNTFRNNFGGLAGGFGFLRSTPSNVVVNNLITENRALFFGGGIACIRSNTVFANNTITGNTSSYGGGFYCNDSAAPVLYNSILYGNQALGHEVYIWDVRSAPSFHNCNVEGDTSDFEGSGSHEGFLGLYTDNIDSVPQFRMTGSFPYALQPSSPCIDAGATDTTGLSLPPTDMEGLNRIWNGRIDIGAYEWNPGQGVTSNTPNEILITAFPNPAKYSVTFQAGSTVGTISDLVIYNITGKVVRELRLVERESGSLCIRWDLKDENGRRVPAGMYLVRSGNAGIILLIDE